MNIYDLLDQLEGFVGNSKPAFMQSGKVVIDPEELYQMIDQIRTSVPDDIRDAQWVKKEEEQIKRKAQEDYERIVAEAQVRAQELTSETEVYRLAVERVNEMMDEAHSTAHDITLGAFQYANDIMEKIEKQLQIYYDVVQDGKEEIQKSIDEKFSSEQKLITQENLNKATISAAEAEAKANKLISESLTEELVEKQKIEKWNGVLPQVASNGNAIIDMTNK